MTKPSSDFKISRLRRTLYICVALFTSSLFLVAFQNFSPTQLGGQIRIVDAQRFGFPYAYGAAIIYAEGKYHAYYCTTGTGETDWDHVRYSVSSDMHNWSSPVDILQSTYLERANCDPSIVKFKAPNDDSAYYYLAYGGSVKDKQGMNFIARSKSLTGPFLKYTVRGTWEPNPVDSHAIVRPFKTALDSENVYGAGQPSLVISNGLVYQWYNDTTFSGISRTFLVTSKDMINWTAPVATSVVGIASVDVKYDPNEGVFVMFALESEHFQSASLVTRESIDGINWTEFETLCDTKCFPSWSNNVGVSSNDQGHLFGSQILISYGAPQGLSASYTSNDCNLSPRPYCWGHWDLYGMVIQTKPRNPVAHFAMAYTSAPNALWPESNAKDASYDTVYSSQIAPSAANTDNKYLAAWTDGKKQVNKLVLTARMYNGQPLGFPKTYHIYVTSPDNSRWDFLGTFSTQPDQTGAAIVSLGRVLDTYGVLVVPNEIGQDNLGNYVFQLADIKFATSLKTYVPQGISNTYPLASGYSNDALWSAAAATDGSFGTAYSSNYFSTSNNDRGTFLAAWSSSGQKKVSKAFLRARMVNGRPTAFPSEYYVYLTSPNNTKWVLVGQFSKQPDVNGFASVDLGAEFNTHGMIITPTLLGRDPNGNRYFQLAEIQFGN